MILFTGIPHNPMDISSDQRQVLFHSSQVVDGAATCSVSEASLAFQSELTFTVHVCLSWCCRCACVSMFFCLCVFGRLPLFKHFLPALVHERSAPVLLSGANLHLHTKNTSKWGLCCDLFPQFFMTRVIPNQNPKQCMYGICTYIYREIKANVGKYMDGMGIVPHHPGALLFEVLLRRGYLSRCATSRCINYRWCAMSFGTKELFVARLLEPSGLGWDGGWIEKSEMEEFVGHNLAIPLTH